MNTMTINDEEYLLLHPNYQPFEEPTEVLCRRGEVEFIAVPFRIGLSFRQTIVDSNYKENIK